MAATLTNLVRSVISIGSEAVRVELERTIPLLNVKYDAMFNIPAGGTSVTLYTRNVAPATLFLSWLYGILIVDPGNLKPTLALPLQVVQKITGSTNFWAEEVTREVPMLMANQKRGFSNANEGGAVTSLGTGFLDILTALNPAVGSPANDVQCRLLLVGV
jgi:hypothetical protein